VYGDAVALINQGRVGPDAESVLADGDLFRQASAGPGVQAALLQCWWIGQWRGAGCLGIALLQCGQVTRCCQLAATVRDTDTQAQMGLQCGSLPGIFRDA